MRIRFMKPIKYTRHAKNRMRMHNIAEAEVEAAIAEPGFTELSLEGRINAWNKAGGKFLRVTYRDEPARILVITAVKKKKGWR